MNINLINGIFPPKDTIDLITQLISTKINYHERKINSTNNEEDIKFREQKIIQNSLKELRTLNENKETNFELDCVIKIK
jgi:hypothetical protein